MNIENIINEIQQTSKLSSYSIEEIEENRNLRLEMVKYFDKQQNREFALDFLRILTELREDENVGVSGDSLMLACYILGKHKQIEDCIRVWDTKRIDFDTYCYIDIQLVPFQGVKETIEYLKKQTSENAKNALEYVVECYKAGDFDNLEEYYKEIPWFV
ncbi:MAG: hypothetical protein IPN94_06030 [Sphingobacteriales bacterium]|jgi:hypothetical protein|nr:hypothetical protein [Sphingobacteriales bacterium]